MSHVLLGLSREKCGYRHPTVTMDSVTSKKRNIDVTFLDKQG